MARVTAYASGLSLDDKYNRIAPMPSRMIDESDVDIIRLAFFDFDGTLARTPEPEEGRIKYREITGKEYPHDGMKGWWDNPESIDTFEVEINKNVKSEYDKCKSDPNCKVFLLTNRKGKLHNSISKLLSDNGITFDEYDYKNNGVEKPVRIKSYIEKYPGVKEISVWDDRDDQIQMFKGLKSELSDNGIQVNIYEVKK